MPEVPERLSPGQIVHHAYEAIHGDRDPDHARQLLREYVACVDNHEAVPEGLTQYLRDAAASYISATSSVASPTPEMFAHAFGLLRNQSGRPEGESKRSKAIATSMLHARLGGATFEQSWSDAMEKWGCSRTTATSAWAEHKHAALLTLRIGRAMEGEGWSAIEAKRLRKMFGDEPDSIRFLE